VNDDDDDDIRLILKEFFAQLAEDEWFMHGYSRVKQMILSCL
jgi:hypothetical protein